MFGKRELCITTDMNRCIAIRNALSDAGIPSFVRNRSLTNPGKLHGVAVVNLPTLNEYRIYVGRKDYDKAMGVRLP